MFLIRLLILFFISVSYSSAVEVKNDVLVSKIANDVANDAKSLITDGIDPSTKSDELIKKSIDLLKLNLASYSDDFIKEAHSKIKTTIDEVLSTYTSDLGNFDPSKTVYNERFYKTFESRLTDTIKGLLSDSDEEVIAQKIDEVNKNITNLNGIEHKKLLRLGADVDFLYAATFGSRNYLWPSPTTYVGNKNIKVDNKKVVKFELNTYQKDTVILDDGSEVDDPAFIMEAKMQAVETALRINPDPDTMQLKTRIDSANKELNNPEWESDNIQFGAYIAHVNNADTIAISAAMHAYFG
ncbi:MAG: hypothetical protein KAI17_28160, partial [Thiotrichaceae bacterium]|nr:hypothetical protein [Thiotrichaceae bacterium]